MRIELVSHTALKNDGRHTAFTDLVAHDKQLLCAFRSANSHMSRDGVVTILTSKWPANGAATKQEGWAPFATLAIPEVDLRDPKFSQMPDGRLLVTAGARTGEEKSQQFRTYRWIWDGRSWSEPVKIGDDHFWLWRVTWMNGVGVSFGYNTDKLDRVRLYKTADGTSFRAIGQDGIDPSYPNEHALVRRADGSCVCLLRRDGGLRTALVGTSAPPFDRWSWKYSDTRIGGPSLAILPTGEVMAIVRRMRDGMMRTVICQLNAETAELTPVFDLPSGGDTGYPGVVVQGGDLLISYYSSHETPDDGARIYMARCRVLP